MAGLSDFGLEDVDLLPVHEETKVQDLAAFGLTKFDITGESPALDAETSNFQGGGAPDVSREDLLNAVPGVGLDASREDLLDAVPGVGLDASREDQINAIPGVGGQLVDMAAAFNRGVVGIANLPLAGTKALAGGGVELSDIDVIRQATQGGFGPEGFIPEALETITEFFSGGLGFQAGAKIASKVVTSRQAGSLLEAASKGLDEISKVRLQTDILAAFGGGTASTAVNHSEILKESTTAQILAPILGGVAAVTPTVLAKRIAKGVPGQQAKTRASEVLVAAADDPDKVVRELAKKEIINVGGAAQSGDVGVMTLARSLARESSVFEGQLDDQFVTSQRAIQREVEALFTPDGRPVSPTAAQDFIKTRIDDLLLQLDERTTIALEKVQNIALLSQGKIRDIDVSRSAKVHLEKALRDVSNQNNANWSALNQEIPVEIRVLKEAAEEIVDSARKIEFKSLPKGTLEQIIGFKIVRSARGAKIDFKHPVAGGYKEIEPVGELMKLRSDLLAELRVKSKDAISSKQAPIFAKLQGATIEAIENNPLPQNVDPGAYRAAAQFTRKMHETFDQGIIGRVLSSNTKSGEAVLSEKTLATLLSGGRETQAAGVKEITNIALLQERSGGQAVAQSSVLRDAQEYIAAKFQKEVVDPESAANFLVENEEALRRFPQLRTKIASAMQDISVQSGKLDAIKIGKATIEKSAFAKIAGLNGKKAINTVLSQRDPAKTAKELHKLVSKDPEALRGMQRDIADVVLERSLTVSRGLPTLDKQISKAQMSKVMQQMDPVIRAFYGPEQRKNLRLLQQEAAKLQTLREQVARGVDIPRSMVMDLIARATGAKLASSLVSGGGAGPSLIAAQAGSKAGRTIIFAIPESATKVVLEEAMLDSKLMTTLMKRGLAVGKENDRLVSTLAIIIRQNSGAAAAEEFEANIKEQESQ